MSNCLSPIINGPILIVLSQPGMGDLIEEKLLSGKDGALLKSLLSDAGIAPEECSYTLWDCYPGASYTPSIIIAMGNEALKGLTKKSGIKKYRGQTLQLHEALGSPCSVCPTYSIQDLKNVPTFKKTIIADLRNTQQGESEAVAFEFWES